MYVINKSKNLINTVSFLNFTYRNVYMRDFFLTVKVTHSVISKTGDSFIYMQGLYLRFDVIMTLFCLPIIYLLEHCVC